MSSGYGYYRIDFYKKDGMMDLQNTRTDSEVHR